MSYILDALKRAEVERERGVVPGLLSQTSPLRRPIAGPRPALSPLIVAGGTAGLALLALLAWRSLDPVATGSMPAVAFSSPVTSQALAVAPPTAAPTAPAAPTLPPAQLTKPDNGSKADRQDKPAGQSANQKAEPRQQPAAQPVPKVAATPTPVNPRIMPMIELPADMRQTLPKVVITGSTYSDNPAYRMVIINGDVFREGEKPSPDLQLEQIRAKTVVMNFKGLRYFVAY